MNVASYIAGRIAKQRSQSFSRFIIRLCIAATAISVAVMLITLAFVAGFQQAIGTKVFSFWGHIRIMQHDPTGAGIYEELPSFRNDTVEQILRSHPAVKYADVFATRSAMLKTTETIEGVLLKGIEKNFSRERLQPYIIKGKWPNLDDTGNIQEIMISAYTAAQLKADIGSKVLVYFIDKEGNLPRVRPVTVSGIFKTGIEEYDKGFAICHIDLIRKLNGWTDQQIGGYEVTVADYRQDQAISNQLLDHIPVQWYSVPTREIYPGIFDWLQLQNTNKKVILVIMLVVALINLISCLIILVLERTQMIGLLKAIGATDNTVQAIFWRYGVLITTRGIGLGAIIGLGICLLQHYTGFIQLDEANYFVKQAPVKIITWQVLAVMGGTLLISFLVLQIPAMLVKKVRPVQVLRFE